MSFIEFIQTLNKLIDLCSCALNESLSKTLFHRTSSVSYALHIF